MQEEWRTVEEFPKYVVSNYGKVGTYWNKNHTGLTDTLRLVALRYDKQGYHRVTLHKDGKNCGKFIAVLVLETFVGPRPDGMQSCHGPDFDKANNRLDNLRWDTVANNLAERRPVVNGCKLNVEDIKRIKRILAQDKPPTIRSIAASEKVSSAMICRIKYGKAWTHVCIE